MSKDEDKNQQEKDKAKSLNGTNKEDVSTAKPIQNNNETNILFENENTQEIEKKSEIPTNDNKEAIEDEKLEEKWLNKILEHPIKILKNSDNEQEGFEITQVKNIIDPIADIWFSKQKKKPIIKEPGARKLIKATGATFPKIIPIEKQSDSSSKDREQVWIEATVLFPDGQSHEEYGIANRMNCTDNISQSNLPIMARKRAMHRAFYRSDYIGLYDVYDESETLDVKDEKIKEEVKMLRDKLTQTDMKYKKVINQMCKEIKDEEGELVWSNSDMEKLIQLAKGNSLVSYIAMLRIRHLNKKEQANN